MPASTSDGHVTAAVWKPSATETAPVVVTSCVSTAAACVPTRGRVEATTEPPACATGGTGADDAGFAAATGASATDSTTNGATPYARALDATERLDGAPRRAVRVVVVGMVRAA